MKTFLVALAASLATLAAQAEPQDVDLKQVDSRYQHNWPHWRGPLANGVAPSANPPLEWSEEKNIQWKVKIPGDSTATPIVWENKIFLITAVKTDREADPAPPPPADAPKPLRGAGYNIQ